MGMFDSIIDADGGEWQTKALDRMLDRYVIGDWIDTAGIIEATDFQMYAIGETDGEFVWAFITVRDCLVAEVGVPRDRSLPCIDYQGGPLIDPKESK